MITRKEIVKILQGKSKRCNFSKMNLTGADMSCMDITKSSFYDTVLTNINFSRTVFNSVNFSEVESKKITDCEFSNCTFINCNFDGVNFVNEKEQNQYMMFVHMEGCTFYRTIFNKLIMTRSCIENCKFTHTDFRHADLSNSLFANCAFEGTLFINARMMHSLIDTCGFYEPIGLYVAGPGGSRADMLYVVLHTVEQDGNIILKPMFKTGCFWGDLDQFKQRVDAHDMPKVREYYYSLIQAVLAWIEYSELKMRLLAELRTS